MTQKRRCWTAVAVFALLAGGARVPTLPGPALSRSADPFAGAGGGGGGAAPALHASFATATEVTARGGGDDERADGSDDGTDRGDARTFTSDAIYTAIHTDPLAIHARGGLIISDSHIRSMDDANPHPAEGSRGFAGAPRGAANPVMIADAHWGGGTVGPLAADVTGPDSTDPRRNPAGGRHPGDHDGSGAILPDVPPPVITLPYPGDSPSAVGMPPSYETGPIGVGIGVGAPPPPALHAVPLPAPLALGLSGLALAAASVRKRLGLGR
jgi:hypothetical protein